MVKCFTDPDASQERRELSLFRTLRGANAKLPKQKRGSLAEEVERVRVQLASLRKTGQPVIAGPFTGEVGFELLYWIPLLRWSVRVCPELAEDLIIVSRGGVGGWVEGLGARYVDILALFEPEEFAAHRALADKQRDVKSSISASSSACSASSVSRKRGSYIRP